MVTNNSESHQLLARCMLKDQHRLRRRLRDIQSRSKRGKDVARELETLTSQIQNSVAERERRAQCLPHPEFADELPVNQRRTEIAEAIAKHQVVVICGETGSGKTTQLPKICLELGRGVAGLIGHTQPRRIAARTVATRIAQELNSEPGKLVGYKVRFSDHTGPECYLKVMTDGILLAEIQVDRFLNQYDTLIIDEAHERSLNIDFLLGYLRNLLPKRPDLKLIITSATIDPQRFSQHFNNAPIIEVSGRMYPVETRYHARDETTEDGDDEIQAIINAVDEAASEGGGDILIFLSGEREIRETAEALRKHHPPGTEILPLFSRLSVQEQLRVFAPHTARRIVLATNVAETSLTVPGIRYVIDTGVARISRYSHRSKIQRLPVEPISQASADQRKGRCGRVGPGLCIRLYSEQDFTLRPIYTDPEIQRTNLANVILQMKALHFGDIASFPFVDAPDPRFIRDGIRLLNELQALDSTEQLTPVGKQLARFPIDPKLARMVVAGHESGCLREVLVIVAGLSVQDPRDRPLDKQQQADESHKEFLDEQSDFVSLLKLWNFFNEQYHHLSRHKLRLLCRKRFLSYTRMLEWRDIHSQLVTQCREMKWQENSVEAQYAVLHQSLLSGLLSQIGMRGEEREYIGARDIRFGIFPGSGQFKSKPKWIVTAQLIETSKLYAHFVAAIEPEWIEGVAKHLTKSSHFEPHWEKALGEAAVFESVSLFGLPIVAKRKIHYGRVDPVDARRLFIQHALVQGDYESRAAFFQHNRELLDEVETLEHKSRRPDILVDEHTLFQFYDARIPAEIYTKHDFEKWLREQEKIRPQHLFLTKEALMRHDAADVTAVQFPETLNIDGAHIPLTYQFEPGHIDDGVTLHIPQILISQINEKQLEWLVPGLLREKIIELLRTLPKSLRRNFVPVPNFADAVLPALQDVTVDLHEAISHQLKRMTGVNIPSDAWDETRLPTHLRMNIHILDSKGKVVAQSRDLQQLLDSAPAQHADEEEAIAAPFEHDAITEWDFGEIPEVLEVVHQKVRVKRYPALVDQQDSIALRLVDSAEQAQYESRRGIRRLLMLHQAPQIKYLRKNLPGLQALCVQFVGISGCDELREHIIQASVDAAFLTDHPLPNNAESFANLLESGRSSLVEHANRLCQQLQRISSELATLNNIINSQTNDAIASTIDDVKLQLANLFATEFLLTTPRQWLDQYPRYLKAASLRLGKAQHNPARDIAARNEITQLQKRYTDVMQKQRSHLAATAPLQEFRWFIEELRISLFAQEVKSIMPVSVKRLEKILDASQ